MLSGWYTCRGVAHDTWHTTHIVRTATGHVSRARLLSGPAHVAHVRHETHERSQASVTDANAAQRRGGDIGALLQHLVVIVATACTRRHSWQQQRRGAADASKKEPSISMSVSNIARVSVSVICHTPHTHDGDRADGPRPQCRRGRQAVGGGGAGHSGRVYIRVYIRGYVRRCLRCILPGSWNMPAARRP